MELTLETIRAAHARIAPYIVQTPLLRLPALDDVLHLLLKKQNSSF